MAIPKVVFLLVVVTNDTLTSLKIVVVSVHIHTVVGKDIYHVSVRPQEENNGILQTVYSTDSS